MITFILPTIIPVNMHKGNLYNILCLSKTAMKGTAAIVHTKGTGYEYGTVCLDQNTRSADWFIGLKITF